MYNVNQGYSIFIKRVADALFQTHLNILQGNPTQKLHVMNEHFGCQRKKFTLKIWVLFHH